MCQKDLKSLGTAPKIGEKTKTPRKLESTAPAKKAQPPWSLSSAATAPRKLLESGLERDAASNSSSMVAKPQKACF